MKDTIQLRGAVCIDVYENGVLIERIEDNNLVVDLGRENVAKLVGGIAGGAAVTQIAVGDNGVPAVVADNAITNQFAKPVVSVTQPAPNKVMFNYDIDNTEANGLTIREFGLLNANGVLVARKVPSAEIVKTNAIRLVGSWTLTTN
jgi:hypothetical protein